MPPLAIEASGTSDGEARSIVIVPDPLRTFVPALDFRTSVGYGDGPGSRQRLGFRGAGPTAVITNLGVLEPHPETKQLMLTAVHPGLEVEQVPPTDRELRALRKLLSR